jgi:hypothetical protein
MSSTDLSGPSIHPDKNNTADKTTPLISLHPKPVNNLKRYTESEPDIKMK